MRLARRSVLALLVLLWTAGTLRALLLCMHVPLYAYANSYDETRYASCFHFYPDRPADIAPQQNSPEAPFAHYRFIESGDPMCYWSSELAFSGATALIWHLSEALGGDAVHDARGIAILRWLVLLAMSVAFSCAWLRRNEGPAAIANAALVPLVFADPGNTLYLATFYAEWTALIFAYASIALLLLWRDESRSRLRFALLALVAFALATSKLQHMLLPLALAASTFAVDRARFQRTSWRAVALACGAFAGACFQFAQTSREGLMIDTIRQYNRADVVFTALLPFADDPRALLQEIGVDPGCAIHSGKRAWQLPDLPDRACRGLADFSRTRQLAALLHHPALAARLALHGVAALDPWLADNVGHVEGGRFEKLPASEFSLGRPLHKWPALQLALLALPLIGLAILAGRGARASSASGEATLLVVVTMLATLAVTVLGDGLADTPKQGHLLIDAALTWLVAGLIIAIARRTFAIAGAGPAATHPPTSWG